MKKTHSFGCHFTVQSADKGLFTLQSTVAKALIKAGWALSSKYVLYLNLR